MYRFNFEIFHSPCEFCVDISDDKLAQNIAHRVYKNGKRLEQAYGFFIDSSELSKLNYRTENTQDISSELFGIIKLSLFYTSVTQGAFDIAKAGTLKELIHTNTLTQYNKRRDELLPYASCKSITLKDNQIIFSNDITKLDLGGIVKEYAVDQAIHICKAYKVKSALVNFGGDISSIGTLKEKNWNIGIQHPNNNQENISEVNLNDNSLCTSGHTRNFNIIENKKISHIISDKKQKYSQISVTAPTTTDAGVWATALLADTNLRVPNHIEIVSSY